MQKKKSNPILLETIVSVLHKKFLKNIEKETQLEKCDFFKIVSCKWSLFGSHILAWSW